MPHYRSIRSIEGTHYVELGPESLKPGYEPTDPLVKQEVWITLSIPLLTLCQLDEMLAIKGAALISLWTERCVADVALSQITLYGTQCDITFLVLINTNQGDGDNQIKRALQLCTNQ